MGTYTELILGCHLKTETPESVINAIKDLIGDSTYAVIDPERSEQNPLLGEQSSYFPLGQADIEYRDFEKQYSLSSRANLKDYCGQVEHFLEWLRPWVHSGSGNRNIWAIVMRDNEPEPEIYYLDLDL